MLPGLELAACTELAVPAEVMHHVVRVESSFNPYAIGVVGGRLARQPQNLGEALSTTKMLEREGYNFSLGLAQVNRYNLQKQGLDSYEKAFGVCPNLQAGSRILAECYSRSKQDWGKAFSCYYSGNFTTGYRHGYVDKVMTSWRGAVATAGGAIPVIRNRGGSAPVTRIQVPVEPAASRVLRRIEEAALSGTGIAPATRASGYSAAAGQVYPSSQASSVYPTSTANGVYPASSAQQVYPATAVPARRGAGQGGTGPEAALQAIIAGAQGSEDAPVLLQPMGAPPVSQPAAAPPATLPSGAAGRRSPISNQTPAAGVPERDAALVF